MIKKNTISRYALRTVDALVSHLPEALLRLPVNDAGARLSPFLQVLRHLRRLSERANGGKLSAETMRPKFLKDMMSMRAEFPVGKVRELTIPTAGYSMPARLYQPAVEDELPELPVLLVFLHGGGYIMGDLDTHDDGCRLLCQHSGMSVLSVAYRLAPEHPFPAAIDDAHAAVRWALEQRAQFGARVVAVGGDSAGANMAAVTAQLLADTDLCAQLLLYPSTDQVTQRPSQELFGDGYFLNKTDRAVFYHNYIGSRTELKSDPRVSPLLNTSIGRVAPALIVTGGFDMLRDEGKAYAAQLKNTGCDVEQAHFERLGHAFLNFAGVHADSKRAVIQTAKQWHDLCQRILKGQGL